MSLRELLRGRLWELEREGLLRREEEVLGGTSGLINVCSNDYLGRAAGVVSRETPSPAGAGASRLIHGTRREHRVLEDELARWVGAEAALVFSSGYAANVGAIAALCGPGDLIVSDALNHASIIDGCRLSPARVIVTQHRDLRAIRQALVEPAEQRWIVTESYFSMDGVSPDLRALRALADEHGALLLVDEAHALGVFGPEGAGLCRAADVRADALVGTLGKAIGLQGAFVAGSVELREYLWNRARSFVFSTATSPALAVWALGSVRSVRDDGAARDRLTALSGRFEEALRRFDVPLASGRHGPIFPILVGTPERAVAAARTLRQDGFLAQAIRPPTVPSGTSRLRIALNSELAPETVDALARAVKAACFPS